MAFLDELGLDRLWQNIVAKLNNKIETEIKVLDDKIENELDSKMDKVNPVGEGSFHMNPSEAEKGEYSSTLGFGNKATSYAAHAEGYNATASNYYSHAEGYYTMASGNASHAEGNQTTASGLASHTEGYRTKASGTGSHAEGDYTTASGNASHAEGEYTTASGKYSHAEGVTTTASGDYSHAEGEEAIASGACSHAEGSHTTASSPWQHVQGKFNIEDANSTYAHIVGNGSNYYNTGKILSNAHTLDWFGNAWFQGNVFVGSTSGKNKDEGSKKLATVDDVVLRSEIEEEDALQILMEMNMVAPVMADDGSVYVDENGAMYSL